MFAPHSSCVSFDYQRLFVYEVNSKLSEQIVSKIKMTALSFLLAVCFCLAE